MIYISYFAKQKKMPIEDAAYASVSVGNPKYAVPYQIRDAKILKPYGIFGKYEFGAEYEAAYRRRLERYGVEAICYELERLQGNHKNLVLMCHEKNKLDCHRWMFAKWWYEQTGEVILEWGESTEDFFDSLDEKELDQISLL